MYKLKQLDYVEMGILLVKTILVQVVSPAFVVTSQQNALLSSGVHLIIILMDCAHALLAKISIMDKR